MTRPLLALLAAAWIGLALAQPEKSACLRARQVSSDVIDLDHHLAQARCWLAARSYAEALLAVERFLALQPGDAQGLALQDSILRLLGHESESGSVFAGGRRADKPAAGGWLAIVTGYDSNANSGTDAREVSLPLFRDRIIDIESKFGELRRRPSALIGARAGFDAALPLSARTQLQFLGSAAGRYNHNAPEYLPYDARLQAQAEHRAGAVRYGLWLDTDQRWLARYRSLDAWTAGIRVSAPAWREYEVGLFGAQSWNRLPLFGLQTREQRAGLVLQHATLPIRVTAFQGSERALGELRVLDRDIRGLAAEFSIPAGPGRLDAAVSAARSNYVQYSQLFLSYRVDQLLEAQVSYEYPLAPAWSVVPRLIVLQNRSNVPLTDFSRYQLLAELRWRF